MIEIHSISDFDAHVERSGNFSDVVVQGLNLKARSRELRFAKVEGALFLGCEFSPDVVCGLISEGAILFPRLDGIPFHTYRNRLYDPEELLGAFDSSTPYDKTLDGQIYQHYLKWGGPKASHVKETLARRLHDHAMTDARNEFIKDRKVVAIMGGHSLERNEAGYREVAHMAASLSASGHLMTSGGGPGAMEATHLGAWFCERDSSELEEALETLATAPSFEDTPAWLASARKVASQFPRQTAASESLGIPTWLYGHEPATLFASHIAKYFANSVREDGLLTIATQGIIFTPGSAGTIQEIFQDATQNHYETLGFVSPMIFFGEEYWTETKPIYPLLRKLAEGKNYHDWIRVTDDPKAVLEWIQSYELPPIIS